MMNLNDSKEILHYDECVTKDTEKADIKAKYYLNNNISDDIKFKDKMEDMKYPRDEDIYLFISEIEMIFEELRDLKI
ncbi:hypothetical protein H8356DRAFT_1328929 [Neocallimastix lanati (nom. inval.)]|nr:hypothetical protein H8356DRAFT_1328929 [Neocallimastix sp. JGI-2020a]